MREKGGENKTNEFVYFLIHRNSMILHFEKRKTQKNKEQKEKVKKEENE